MSSQASRMAEMLDAWWNSWRAIEMTTHCEQQIAEGVFPGPTVTQVDSLYCETAAGQRYLDVRAHFSDGRTRRSSDYCDGKRSAGVLYQFDDDQKQTQIVIKKAFSVEDKGPFTSRPIPLKYYYVGHIPLQAALPRSEYIGQDQVAGRDCETFRFSDVLMSTGKKILVYHLDKETAIPLSVEAFDNTDAYHRGQPYLTWRATALETINGRMTVVESLEEAFERTSNQPTTTHSSKYSIKQVVYDKSYTEQFFWPKPQPGVTVLDYVSNKFPMPATTPAESSSTTAPIRVDHGGGSWLSTVSLGLGLAVLLTALVLWWRRR